MNSKITIMLIISLIAISFSKYSTAQTAPHKSKKGVPSTIKATARIPAIAMVFVQGGSFKMGSDTVEDATKPHQVTLSDFNIGKYEVTQAQWLAVMGTKPSLHQDCANCPVEEVSYNSVQAYITKLNKITRKTYRLPTEAEWEYAARGGNKSNNYAYSGSNNINDVGWYYENAKDNTHPVGQKLANELGIYDMTGNVWEWCQDWYNEEYYASSPLKNPQGPSTGTNRILRGGSWYSGLNENLNTIHVSWVPEIHDDHTGFRLVLVN